MEIYILRDGREAGPFNEEMMQSLLKQGSVLINDPAWTPGLAAWTPLVQVLYPAAAPVPESAHVEPAPEPAAAQKEWATAKQKAFLTFFGIPISGDLTRERAAVLVNEAMENPKLAARLKQWNDDRLKLHPELFADELQEMKENRGQIFFELCEKETERLQGVTKAHCQVLIGYLDVQFPNWDAHPPDVRSAYFFAAIAEKFPVLVRKPWREKLKYPDGPRVAPELVKAASIAPQTNGRAMPFAAILRGMVSGLAILLALYVGWEALRSEPSKANPAPTPAPAAADAKPKPAGAPSRKSAPVEKKSAPAVADAAPADPEKPMSADAVPADGDPANPAPAPEGAAPAAPEPKTFLALTKAVPVQLPFGSAMLPAGSRLKIVEQQGDKVKAIYAGSEVTVPLDATDLAPKPADPTPGL
jgi:hypothetical protein